MPHLNKNERDQLFNALSSTDQNCIEESMKLYKKNNEDPAIKRFVEYTGNVDAPVILSDYVYDQDHFRDGLIILLAGAQADKKMAAREKEEEGKEDWWEEFEKYVGNRPEDRARELFDRMYLWEVKLVIVALELAHQGDYETAIANFAQTTSEKKGYKGWKKLSLWTRFPMLSKSSNSLTEFKVALLGFYTPRLQ